jgi:hypothetical protein
VKIPRVGHPSIFESLNSKIMIAIFELHSCHLESDKEDGRRSQDDEHNVVSLYRESIPQLSRFYFKRRTRPEFAESKIVNCG